MTTTNTATPILTLTTLIAARAASQAAWAETACLHRAALVLRWSA